MFAVMLAILLTLLACSPVSGVAIDSADDTAADTAEEVKLTLQDVPGLDTVHDLHVWTLDGRTVVLSAHLVAAPGANAASVRRAVEARLIARYGAVHSTLQLEGGDDACAAPYCPLTSGRRS